MESIQTKMKTLFESSCYAYCLEYLYGNKRTIKDLTKALLDDWDNGYIEDDGYVSKPLSIVRGYRDVKKPIIETLEDLPNDENYIVEYRWKNKQHFVVANKNGIIFDPAGESNTVKYGNPATYRLFVK